MNSLICTKCHSERVEVKEFNIPFYYSVRVKCGDCGHVTKMTQRWVRPGVWKQTGHCCVNWNPLPFELKIVLDYDPEYREYMMEDGGGG